MLLVWVLGIETPVVLDKTFNGRYIIIDLNLDVSSLSQNSYRRGYQGESFALEDTARENIKREGGGWLHRGTREGGKKKTATNNNNKN